MTAKELFAQALERIEGPSIRAWAESEHNRLLWLQIAESAIAKAKARDTEPDVWRFAAYIQVTALGL